MNVSRTDEIIESNLFRGTIYVDQFPEFLDPSLPIGRPFDYRGLFSKVDIWLTPPSLSIVYVECESPLRPKYPEAPKRSQKTLTLTTL